MRTNADMDLDNVLELMAVPGEAGKEAEIAQRISQKLVAMGVPAEHIVTDDAHQRCPEGGEIGNLIVRLDGHGRGERRMLATHLDTVPGAVGSRPTLRGDRVVSGAPGTCLGSDARAGCAVLLAGVRALLARGGDHPPYTFVFFVQEEIGLAGARWLDVSLLGDPLPAMCFNFDGGPIEEIVTKVIGAERLHLTVAGVAAHTMHPRRGISAAVITARAAAEMIEAGWHGVVEQPDGRGLANLGVLRGGAGSNVVMPELYALIEGRSYDKAFRIRIIDEWKSAFRRAVDRANAEAPDADGRADVAFRPGPVYDPYALPDDAPVVREAADAVRRIGLEPRSVDDDGGQDAAWVVTHGIPAVGLSYGGYAAHSPDEWLDVKAFEQACRLAGELVSAT